jgi:hypothetical protein
MMLNIIMEKSEMLTYKDAQVATEIFDKSHGSYFDRGSADSYYHRPRDPHRGGVGGNSGPRIDAIFESDIQAYHAGYDYNEQYGDKKDWG